VSATPLSRSPDDDQVAAMLARRGYVVCRGLIPAPSIEAALRTLHLALVRKGVAAETVGEWLKRADCFPTASRTRRSQTWRPSCLLHSVRARCATLRSSSTHQTTCGELPLRPHLDREPEWAAGRRYLRIVAVALSPARRGNGALHVWPYDGTAPEPVELEPGDVVVMELTLPHTSGLNRSGHIRYAVYFRFLGG
jgi:hypothetical protein